MIYEQNANFWKKKKKRKSQTYTPVIILFMGWRTWSEGKLLLHYIYPMKDLLQCQRSQVKKEVITKMV